MSPFSEHILASVSWSLLKWSVPNRFLRISVLFLLSVSSSFMNSPWASMTIWFHCSASMPRMSPILESTSLTDVLAILPSTISSAVGETFVRLPVRVSLQ